MAVAKVAIAIAVGSCKVTTGIGGLTFQAIIGKLADAAIVQHVAERTIVVSIAGHSSRNEQIVRHDGLLRFVEVCVLMGLGLMVGTCPTIYQNLVLYKEDMPMMHAVRAGITASVEFLIEMRIAIWADKNTCLLSNLKDFFERREVDTTIRQNGFHHVDIMMGNESREVQYMGHLGVEIELDIRPDRVYPMHNVIPHGDILLAKEVTGRMYPDIPTPTVSTLWQFGDLLDDGVHELERRMNSREVKDQNIVCQLGVASNQRGRCISL